MLVAPLFTLLATLASVSAAPTKRYRTSAASGSSPSIDRRQAESGQAAGQAGGQAGGQPGGQPGADTGAGGNAVASWSTVDGSTSMANFVMIKGNLPEGGLQGAPDGSQAIKQTYPAGHFAGDETMLNFYTAGPEGAFDPTTAKEIMFTYKVWFNEDFEWVKGGKLPGLYGATEKSEIGCSGGRQRDDCFSTRLMWRKEGAGEVYDYFPNRQQAVCSDERYNSNGLKTICDDKGMSLARGAFNWAKGSWVEVGHRVKLNDIGQPNGEQELFVNGESKIKLDGLEIRTQDNVKFQGIMAQSFFGGGSEDWAPSKDETAYFKDFELKALQNL